MWITNVSPTARAGSPDALCNMPDASIATWPRGSHTIRKIAAASAGIVRWTSKRSLMAGIMTRATTRDPPALHGTAGLEDSRARSNQQQSGRGQSGDEGGAAVRSLGWVRRRWFGLIV